MAHSAVSVGEDRTDLIGVPVFWPKPTTEPFFLWESWIGQLFLAGNLRKHCNANIHYTNAFFYEADQRIKSRLFFSLGQKVLKDSDKATLM